MWMMHSWKQDEGQGLQQGGMCAMRGKANGSPWQVHRFSTHWLFSEQDTKACTASYSLYAAYKSIGC